MSVIRSVGEVIRCWAPVWVSCCGVDVPYVAPTGMVCSCWAVFMSVALSPTTMVSVGLVFSFLMVVSKWIGFGFTVGTSSLVTTAVKKGLMWNVFIM